MCFLHHWSEWNNEIHCGARLSLKQQKGFSHEIHWEAFFFWHILINISNWCIFPLQIFFFFLSVFFPLLIPVNMVELCGKVMVAGKNDFFFFFLHSTKTKFTTTIGFPPPRGGLTCTLSTNIITARWHKQFIWLYNKQFSFKTKVLFSDNLKMNIKIKNGFDCSSNKQTNENRWKVWWHQKESLNYKWNAQTIQSIGTKHRM